MFTDEDIAALYWLADKREAQERKQARAGQQQSAKAHKGLQDESLTQVKFPVLGAFGRTPENHKPDLHRLFAIPNCHPHSLVFPHATLSSAGM